MEEIAKLYCNIFQEPSWKESFVPEQVMETMREQFNKPEAIALTALEDGEMIGFSWMYEIFQNDLKKGTRYSPKLEFLFNGQKRVFYFQEIGIKKELRGQNNGEKLVRELLKRGREEGADIVVLSTNSDAKSIISLVFKIGFRNSGIIRPPEELGRTYWFL